MSNPDIATLLRYARARLTPCSDTPRLDAEVLLAYALAKSRTYLYTWPEHIPDAATQHFFSTLLERRRRGEPVAYLTGQRAFWSFDLRVTPDTLIPRPESELLVRLALTHLPQPGTLRIADLGTGSGALALALAQERPDAEIIAVDNDPAALAVARTNAQQLGLTHVVLIRSYWCDALACDQFDVIVTNPPYIAANSPWLQQGDVRFEPTSALVSGDDGLDAIRQITQQALCRLKPGGWLLLEHGFDQGRAVSTLLRQHGFIKVSTHSDHSGHDRVSGGSRPR
jgi:release factor glutamine methyltransferase